jgi:hypothetical protein
LEVLSSERFSLPPLQDDIKMCGFTMKHTIRRGTQNWWLGMWRIVVKTHTDLCNNAIKNMQIKFKGEEMK